MQWVSRGYEGKLLGYLVELKKLGGKYAGDWMAMGRFIYMKAQFGVIVEQVSEKGSGSRRRRNNIILVYSDFLYSSAP